MEQPQTCRMLWQKREDGRARLLRMYGTSPQVFLPQQIAGRPCVEIAPYCFAKEARLPEAYFEETISEGGAFVPFLQELCANVIEEVYLPDTVETIGNCAFYNCKKLISLSMGSAVKDIGSDAFMNTLSFYKIILRCLPDEKSSIQKVLSQISSDLQVLFEQNGKRQAALFYPDYYESYDEVAPAHLFGRNISGEGFRARQCFRDGKIDFAGYDAVFLQACVEEPEETLLKMALGRLRYPWELKEGNREIYQNYLLAHIKKLADNLIRQKDLETLLFLCDETLLRGEDLHACTRQAAEYQWPEGVAALLQKKAVLEQNENKNRYDFDAW